MSHGFSDLKRDGDGWWLISKSESNEHYKYRRIADTTNKTTDWNNMEPGKKKPKKCKPSSLRRIEFGDSSDTDRARDRADAGDAEKPAEITISISEIANRDFGLFLWPGA